MYIGPGQYFVITDIGRGRYQWYTPLVYALLRTPRTARRVTIVRAVRRVRRRAYTKGVYHY